MFRLLLLMAMGLGALYMMHLLAQDYNKIRQPVAAAAKALSSASATLNRGKRETAPTLTTTNNNQNATLTIDWKRILSRDPFQCLQSLICQLMSGAESHSHEALTLMNFVESTLSLAPAQVGRAFSRGLALRGLSERCYDEYPFCVYSAKTMLRVLKWFSDTSYAEVSLE